MKLSELFDKWGCSVPNLSTLSISPTLKSNAFMHSKAEEHNYTRVTLCTISLNNCYTIVKIKLNIVQLILHSVFVKYYIYTKCNQSCENIATKLMHLMSRLWKLMANVMRMTYKRHFTKTKFLNLFAVCCILCVFTAIRVILVLA